MSHSYSVGAQPICFWLPKRDVRSGERLGEISTTLGLCVGGSGRCNHSVLHSRHCRDAVNGCMPCNVLSSSRFGYHNQQQLIAPLVTLMPFSQRRVSPPTQHSIPLARAMNSLSAAAITCDMSGCSMCLLSPCRNRDHLHHPSPSHPMLMLRQVLRQ